LDDKEFTILLKLGKSGHDFYSTHDEVIKKYGYVDFARVGNKRASFPDEKGSTIYIKESSRDGDRIFECELGEKITVGEHYPSYYEEFSLENAFWLRIVSLNIISKEDFISRFCLRSGEEIKGLDRGMMSFFYIKEKTCIK